MNRTEHSDNILEVQQKLQQCVKYISPWYKINRLKINIDKTGAMLIGSKAQLKSLNVDDFILGYDDTPLELVENAKYLGMFINCDISWDFLIRRLCQSMYCHESLLRRLRRIFPMNFLLQVYKSYIQPRLDYGITLYGCSTRISAHSTCCDISDDKQRVLMHRHQGWNVRHGFCHIYMRYVYIYIYELLIAFVCFVVCSLLYSDGICGVLCGKWQSRESTGMFGNLMAIYYIMPQFIQNHSRFVMLTKTCKIS